MAQCSAAGNDADFAHCRTPVLFRFYSVFLVAELVANPLGGFLVGKGPWLTLAVGNVFMILVMGSVCIFPETLAVRLWHDKRAGKMPSPQPTPLDGDDGDELKKSGMQAALGGARRQLTEVWEFLIGNRRLVVLMLPLIFVTLGKYIQEMLLQYATKRFGWSWSKVHRPLPPTPYLASRMQTSSLTRHAKTGSILPHTQARQLYRDAHGSPARLFVILSPDAWDVTALYGHVAFALVGRRARPG